MKYSPALAFLAVVIATNIGTANLGVVHWLGVTVTAGTWLAGFAFVARDATHDRLGRRWVAGVILAGAIVTAFMDPRLATASATAFLLSESADFAVYEPLRRRGYLRAALASNAAGAVVDSVAFLAIAGFPMSLTGPQVAIKWATTAVFVLTLGGVRALLRQPVHAGRSPSHD